MFEVMKEKIEAAKAYPNIIIKKMLHNLWLTVSIALTVGLFVVFSEDPVYKWIWAIFGFSMEIGKDYLVKWLKTFFRDSKALSAWQGFSQSIIQITIYLGFAVLSLAASAAFALNSISQQSEKAMKNNEVIESSLIDDTKYDFEIEGIKSSLNGIDREIDNYYTLAEKNGTSYRTAISDAQKRQESKRIELKQYKDLKEELTAQRSAQMNATKDNVEINSMDSFDLLGRELNMEGEDVLKYMMYLLAILIELFILVTATAFKKLDPSGENEESFSRRKLRVYIDSLFEVSGKRLKRNDEINKDTVLSMAECREIRAFLMKQIHKGIPLIEVGRGIGTKSSFSKEDFWKIADFKLNRA